MKDEKKRALYTCGFCRKSWKEKNSYLKHSKVCRRAHGSLPRRELRCHRCRKTFVYAKSFRNHECNHRCPRCAKTFDRASRLRDHKCDDEKKKISIHRCPRCVKTFDDAKGLREHRCVDEVARTWIKTCPFCGKDYRREFEFKKHVATCDGKWLASLGFEKKKRRTFDVGPRRRGQNESEYVCNKCRCRFAKLDVSNVAFHRCVDRKMKSAERQMGRYKNRYSKMVLTDGNMSKRELKDRECFKCGKLFPTKEKCFFHYARCKKKRDDRTRRGRRRYEYFKCNFCGDFFELFAVLQRHLRDHAYEKRMAKKLGVGKDVAVRLRGGGDGNGAVRRDDVPGPSSRPDDGSASGSDDDDDVPLAHRVGERPVIPKRWGWTTHVIDLQTPDFDGELLARLILEEIRSQIAERKRLIRSGNVDREGRSSSSGEELSDDDELESDARFSTLSMIANLKVYFYKIDLGSALGEKKQTIERNRPFPRSGANAEGDEDETLVDAYFHSSPVRLLSGNLEEEVHYIVENFMLQVDEYTTLKSGMKLFQVSQCELSFYNFKSMVGGKGEEIPSHCHVTLHALYSHGKILHVSYDNVSEYIRDVGGETSDVYTDNCFAHVLAAHSYLKNGHLAKDVAVKMDGDTGCVLDKYTEVRVKDVMDAEKSERSLRDYDFSMCADNGRPMMLEDVGKFYRSNYEKNKAMPVINVFKLDYADSDDDVDAPGFDVLGNGIEARGYKTEQRFVITHYFLARDFDDESDDGRDVINVLYWRETKHFYLITNLKALVLAVNFNNSATIPRSRSKLCYVCVTMVDVRFVDMKDHVKLCRARNNKQHVRFPVEGKNVEKFKNFKLMNKLQFYVSADTECSVVPIKKPDSGFLADEYAVGGESFDRNIKASQYENAFRSENFPYKGTSKKLMPTHVHRLNSIGWKLYVDEEICTFPRERFVKEIGDFMQIIVVPDDSESEAEKLVDRFMDWLNKASEFIRNWLKKINDKQFQANVLTGLKEKHAETIKNSTHCIYCEEKLREPVPDHCHTTFKLRGMACTDCNLRARRTAWMNFKLQVYTHNFRHYDSCFITKYMKRPAVGKGATVGQRVWKCRVRGNKIHQVKTNLLDFRDSMDLFPISIAKLSDNLPSDRMEHVNEIKWPGETDSKNIYPYEMISSVKRFDDEAFPDIDDFESSLTGKISNKDYDSARRLYDENCTTFRDWHVHYLQMDVCILLDALAYWQGVIFKEFGIDLLQCHSLPSCAKQSLLKMSRVCLELITEPTMHSLFQNNIKGGLCVTALRSREVIDQTKESIRYFDVKSLYASVQKLYRHPVGGFKFLTPTPTARVLHAMAMEYDEKEADTGYLCVVDLHIPQELHWMLSDFPVTYQKMTVEPHLYPPSSKWHHLPRSKTSKLVPSLIDPENYGVSMLTLSFLVRLGIRIERVRQVVEYRQEYFLRDFVDICLKKRKESGLKMDDVTFKLIANGLFGKFIENAFLYTDTRFVFYKKDYERILQNATRFVNAKFETYGVLMQSKLSVVKMDKSVAVGWSILCKSKTHFQQMYYYRILPSYVRVARPLTFQNRLRVLYVDTDSLMLYLCLDSDQETKFYSLLSDIFDFSTLPKNDRFYSVENKFKVGIFKDEVSGLLIKAQHSNGAKSYLYTIYNNTGLDVRLMNEKERKIYYPRIKMKALSKHFQSNLLTEDDFLQAFRDPNQERSLTYTSLRIGNERKMYTFTCNKKVLDPHDSKRWVYPSQLDSLALGHYLTLDPNWVGLVMDDWKSRENSRVEKCE